MLKHYANGWKQAFNVTSESSTKELIYFYIVAYLILPTLLFSIPQMGYFIGVDLGFTEIKTLEAKITVLTLLMWALHFTPKTCLLKRRLNKIGQHVIWLIVYYLIIFILIPVIAFVKAPSLITTYKLPLLLVTFSTIFELLWLGREE